MIAFFTERVKSKNYGECVHLLCWHISDTTSPDRGVTTKFCYTPLGLMVCEIRRIRWLTPAVIDILPRKGSGQICLQNADTPWVRRAKKHCLLLPRRENFNAKQAEPASEDADSTHRSFPSGLCELLSAGTVFI